MKLDVHKKTLLIPLLLIMFHDMIDESRIKSFSLCTSSSWKDKVGKCKNIKKIK